MRTASKTGSDDRRDCYWFVSRYLPPVYSGAALNDLLLARELVKLGKRVVFIGARAPREAPRTSLEGFEVLELAAHEPRGLRRAKLAWASHRELMRRGSLPAVVRTRGFAFDYALLLATLRWRHRSICRIAQPACYGIDNPEAILKRPLGTWQVRELLRADALFAMNAAMKQECELLGFPRDRIFEVRNPVDCNRFVPVKEPAELRRALGVRADLVTIVTLGILTDRKRQDVVTAAVARLAPAQRNSVQVIHVGPCGEDLREIGREDLVAESAALCERIRQIARTAGIPVYLPGHARSPERWLGAADVFVLASEHEGEANVVNEAMSCGVPVVVPDTDVYRRQVPEPCGITFAPGSEEKLADALSRLVDDDGLRREMGGRARRHVLETRSPEVVARAYAECIEQAIAYSRARTAHVP